MSSKHEEIDLNADAVSGDRENESDAPVMGESVAGTLTEPCTIRGGVQRSEDEKVKVFDSAMLICDLNVAGNDVSLNSEGVDREADVLGRVENEVEKGSQVDAKAEESNSKCGDDISMHDENEVKKGSEQLVRGVDAKAEENNRKCGEDVYMHDENEVETEGEQLGKGLDAKAEENNGKCGRDVSTHDETEVKKGSELLDRGFNAKAKENNEKCGEDVSMLDENEVEGASVAVRASSEAEMLRDMNVGPVGEELEQGTLCRDTIESLHPKFEDATSDELENKAMEVNTEAEPKQETNDGDKVQSLHQKFEEATFDGLENKAVEVDIPTKLECRENQLVDIPAPEERDSSNVLNESHAVNLVVDLHPYMAKGGNAYSEVNAKLVTSRSEFYEGDLVWGKVRSHPWWPGQMFNHSAASQKAKKYFKKASYLIAYFGDQTFAWNDASKIKPFQEHFAHMEKQTSLEDFHDGVDCALEEVARRVEFGLACSCITEEAYAKIKTQIIVNAGIREESSTRDGGDRFSNAVSFEPVKLSEHIKALARLPYYSEVDRLGFVTVKAQLSAFYRWKGYWQLPEFNVLGGLLESDAEIPLSGLEHEAELTQSSAPDFNGDKKASSDTGKLKSQGGSSHKRKHSSGDSIHPSKKEKSLSDLLAERRANMSNGKQRTYGKGDELISLSSGKKHKSVDSISDDRVVKHKKLDSISADMSVKSKKLDSISDDMSVKQKKSDMLVVNHEKGDLSVGDALKCLPIKKTFGVGNSILKVASQLNGLSPIFKSGDVTCQKTVVRNKSKEKSLFRKSQSKKQFPSEETSPAELLSQLRLAARDPMEGYNLLISLVSFFLEFRNSVSLEQSQEEVSGDKTGKTRTNSETTLTSGSEPMKDTYWTDRIIENIPQEQQALENKNEGEILHETPNQKDSSLVESTSAVQLSAYLESALETAGETFEQEAVKPADPFDGCCCEDHSPTALILNFTDLDSVPSKENMTKIFSRFGPLNELGTEVKSKHAKVVFKRRADAETAFSSAGKYSVFGPSLVSYCLKYMPSTSTKTSSCAAKQDKNAAISEGENATSCLKFC